MERALDCWKWVNQLRNGWVLAGSCWVLLGPAGSCWVLLGLGGSWWVLVGTSLSNNASALTFTIIR